MNKLLTKREALKIVNRDIEKQATVLLKLLTWRNRLQRWIRKEQAAKR